jgi:hypothetical protein
LPESVGNGVVVVDPDPLRSGDQQQQQQQQQRQQMLLDAGVWPDVAPRLAADPWVTEDRIRRSIAGLRADPTVIKLGAVLAANLGHHRQPPPTAEELEARRARRYIEGAYAEYIRH